jgi:pimeloyl-ACP methyl ester carboxylesterase
VRWVGTSLGGICGMLVAAARNTPVSHLVLNDIGPFVPVASLERIGAYLSESPDFADQRALEAHLRRIHAPFGPLTDAQWAHLARYSGRTLADGRVTMHYDPKMIEPIVTTEPKEIDLWGFYRAIRAKVLAIRGAESDLFLPETLEAMRQQGAEGLVVPDTGHAPALMDVESIGVVRRFLEST